jgi:hypothetical protein
MLKKMLVLLAVLLVFPVVAYASITTNGPYMGMGQTTLACGTGTVPLRGAADAVNGYTFLLINFGPVNGPWPVALQKTISGMNVPWEVMVNVTQGQTYKIFARLINTTTGGDLGRVFTYTVPACVTVQVVERAITPQLVPSERWRGAETEPFHHGEPLHTRR